jgi:hypothetical protein
MTKYQLNCSCGTAIPVETSQSGRYITCKCGKELLVPPLRELRQLSPIKDDTAATDTTLPRRHWHPVQGILFVLGLLLTVGSLGGAAYVQSYRMSLDTEEKPYDNLDAALRQIDGLQPAESFKAWEVVREKGIGERNPPDFVVAREISKWLWKVILGMFAGFGLGVALIVASFLVRLPAARPSARR